jgi:hypothetical protein
MTYGDAVLMFAMVVGFAVCAAALVTFGLAVFFTGRDAWRRWRDRMWIYGK